MGENYSHLPGKRPCQSLFLSLGRTPIHPAKLLLRAPLSIMPSAWGP